MPKLLKIYGTTWCPDTQRVKKFLGRHGQDYQWVDIDRSAAAATEAKDLSGGQQITPVLVLPDQSVLVVPSDRELAGKLGVPVEGGQEYHELAIVGAGPTGMAAAIYTTREDIETVLYEREVVGGMAGITAVIDNYPGFPEGVSGIDLAEDMEKQARRFGALFKLGTEVKGLTDQGRYKLISTSEGDHLAKAVLIATGGQYRKLEVPGETELTGRGVHYCATCDGPLYKDKHLIVVGGGNSAMQEGIFLTKFAREITLLVRDSRLKGSEFLINKVKSMPQIKVHYNTVAKEIKGENNLFRSLVAEDKLAGQTKQYEADGMFIFVGMLPNTHWLQGSIKLDPHGFIQTGKTFQTSMEGVFAAGDVRAGATLQLASAAGEGVVAALMIREYLKELG